AHTPRGCCAPIPNPPEFAAIPVRAGSPPAPDIAPRQQPPGFYLSPLQGAVFICHIIIALTGMPAGGGILSAVIEHSANPAEPIEALGLTRRLMELYPNRLYLELAFHGNSAEKLVNRG